MHSTRVFGIKKITLSVDKCKNNTYFFPLIHGKLFVD